MSHVYLHRLPTRLSSMLIGLLIVLPSTSACAAEIVQRIPEQYAQPGQMIRIAKDRQLNLRCSGAGERSILLEAGSHADSSAWFRLQPLLARSARVCAYDRAGFGFSDEGPMPRNLTADVADLHALINDAQLPTPVILVGHSLGTNIARRYAAKYPHDLAALVLIDPPAQNVAAFAPKWAKQDKDMNAQRFAFIHKCEKAAEKGALATPPKNLKSCIAPVAYADAKVSAAMTRNKLKPAFWRSLLSELESNQTVFADPVPTRETHASMPLIVLTAESTYAQAPPPLRKLLQAARAATQSRIVATSSHGKRIDVANTSHDIQIDQPRAVAHAITTLIAQLPKPKNSRSQ